MNTYNKKSSYLVPFLKWLLMQARFALLLSLLVVSCSSVRDGSVSHRSSKRAMKSEVTFDQRRIIVDYAMTLIGTRYKYGGTSPNTGFDCSGFTSHVMHKYGFEVPRTSGGQATRGRIVKACDARPGDLVFFGRGKKVDHVGIVVRSNKNRLEIVHSSSSGGVLVEDALGSSYWRKRVLFAVDLASL